MSIGLQKAKLLFSPLQGLLGLGGARVHRDLHGIPIKHWIYVNKNSYKEFQ